MTLRRAMSAITAIIAIIVVMCTTVLAATVQPTVAEVEVTYNNSEASKVATKKYPKSMQKQLLESKDNKEVARALEVAKSLKANTVKVDSYGIAWKSAESRKSKSKSWKHRFSVDSDFCWLYMDSGFVHVVKQGLTWQGSYIIFP